MAHFKLPTKHDNKVSRAIYGRYKSLPDFMDAYQRPGERLRQPTVYEWVERGQVPRQHVPRFAEHFGKPIEYFL